MTSTGRTVHSACGIRPRGPLSKSIATALRDRARLAAPVDAISDADPWGDDLQLALLLCQELHYRADLARGVPDREWEPEIVGFRRLLEDRFLAAVQVESAAAAEGLAERLGEPDPGYGAVEDTLEFDAAIRRLSERDRRILLLRFYEGMTQREIADEVGLSQMHVSRRLRQTLALLGTQLRTEGSAV